VNVPTEGRWALIFTKTYEDGAQSRLTIYGYSSEAAARADVPKWQERNPLYREHVVMPEALVQALVEREGA
jgi:hypothetical protein